MKAVKYVPEQLVPLSAGCVLVSMQGSGKIVLAGGQAVPEGVLSGRSLRELMMLYPELGYDQITHTAHQETGRNRCACRLHGNQDTSFMPLSSLLHYTMLHTALRDSFRATQTAY
jgi:hypothetical protein